MRSMLGGGRSAGFGALAGVVVPGVAGRVEAADQPGNGVVGVERTGGVGRF